MKGHVGAAADQLRGRVIAQQLHARGIDERHLPVSVGDIEPVSDALQYGLHHARILLELNRGRFALGHIAGHAVQRVRV